MTSLGRPLARQIFEIDLERIVSIVIELIALRMKIPRIVFVALLTLLTAVSGFAQRAGSLDLSFDAKVELSGGIRQILEQTNGMILIVGDFQRVNGVRCSGIARLLPSGALDPGFIPPTDIDGGIRTAAIQSDQKIVIGGDFSRVLGNGRRRIARLNADGSLDETFNPGTGVDASPEPRAAAISAIAVQSDGKVLIGGEFTAYNGAGRTNLARLTSTGGVDPGFNAVVIRGPYSRSYDQFAVQTILVQPDGRIMVGGSFATVNGVQTDQLIRLKADGSLDTPFDFPALFVSGGTFYGVTDVRMLVGGDYLVAGSVELANFFPPLRYLAKVNPSGSPYPSFNTTLAGTPSVPISPHAFDLQADGKILMSSLWVPFGFRRLNADLTIDSGFSPGARDGTVEVIKLTASGDVLVGGPFTTIGGKTRYGLARLTGTGAVDDSFQAEVRYSGSIPAISVLPNDGVIAAGTFSTVAGLPRSGVIRIDPKGTSIIDFGYTNSSQPPVTAVLALRSGKSLIAAKYFPGGVSQTNQIRRFNANGSIDPSFNLTNGPDSTCTTMVELSDGRVVIGGDFLSVGGSNLTRIARLETSGAIDPTFSSGTGANSLVRKVLVQSDGKLIVAGYFSTLNGVPRNLLARLLANGQVDADYNPGTNFPRFALDIGLQSGDRLIAVGQAPQIAGGMLRINVDGSVDPGFHSGATVALYSVFIQGVAIHRDDSIVIGGQFTAYDGVPRTNFARLHSDGWLDTRFDPGPAEIRFISLEIGIGFAPNGDVWLGGQLMSFNGVERYGLARFIGIERPKLSLSSTVAPYDFTLTGETGRTYRVEATTNFVNWLPVTNLVNDTGSIQFTDHESTNTVRRFYRAVTD